MVSKVTKGGFVTDGSSDELTRLHEVFARYHVVHLPGFFETALVAEVVERVGKARFAPRRDEGIALESCMEDEALLSALFLLMNDPELLAWIQRVAGREPIGSFWGRVYRFEPGPEHHDSWHTDAARSRMVGLSVNLSRLAYEGGAFQIREGTSDPLREITNTGFGDALLFDIGPALSHRVTSVSGDASRTAFAGWFLREPSFLEMLAHRGSQHP